VLWLLLNPSTATEEQGGLDPTLRRCAGFSRAWGFGGMKVANIFAFRSTDPRGLYDLADPVGPENDAAILEAASACDQVVVGWGLHGKFRGRADAVVQLLAAHELHCLATTQAGEPGHPLYLRGSSNRVVYRRNPGMGGGR
jgi:hypothetical protein